MSIDIQSAVMNELFALYPIIIQGWVAPVKPDGSADGGISKALHDGQVRGLECLVDPLLELRMRGGTMAADDRVDLYVNDDTAAVDGKTVALGEEQQRIRLYVPHGYLRQGVNRLYYKVTRVGGNVEPSRDLHVLYHLRLPDSLDLVIRADVLKEGVDSEKAAQGVEFGFTYNNRRPYDRIEFLLGDATFRFDVPDAPAAVTYTLFTDGFQKAGDNPKAVAEFFVTDQLGNRSKSPEKRLDIHLARLDLDLLAPTVKGMTGNSFSPTQPELRVLVPPGKLLPSDQVSVTWKGATATAQGSYTSPLRLVSAGLEIAVPRSVLAYSLGKAVTVSYSVVRNGQTLPSLALTLNILALPASALNPPKIVEADVNNFLDIIKLGTSNATIHGLLWTLIEVGQQVWLKLEGKKADGTTHNLTVWKGGGSNVNATWVNQGFWPKPLLNSYLKALGDGSTLTLKFKAALDKSNVEANAVVFPDRVYTIMSVALIAPTLTDVTDAKGNKVPNGGTTAETSVTLTGTANKGLEVEIFDGTVSKGKATADPVTGIWSLLVSGLSVTAHSFTAKALYGSGESSTAWTFTVVALATPVISLVKDAKNVVVPNGGTTFSTSLTLTGSAQKGQKVRVLDGTVNKGEPVADPSTGIWTLIVSALSVARHSFTAKALYGAGVSSPVWTITVGVETKPVIASVQGGGAEIPNDGETLAASVKLYGTAQANKTVEIFADGVSKGDANAVGGRWEKDVPIGIGKHVFIARAKYGSGMVSEARTVRRGLIENFDAWPTRNLYPGESQNITTMTLTIVSGVSGTSGGISHVYGFPELGQVFHVYSPHEPATPYRLRIDFSNMHSKVELTYRRDAPMDAAGLTSTVMFYDRNGNVQGQKALSLHDFQERTCTFKGEGTSRIEIFGHVAGSISFLKFSLF